MKPTTAILVAAATFAAGCASSDNGPAESFFGDSQRPSIVARTAAAQSDRGAAVDATLYADHFDGTSLNSLGLARIQSIVRAAGGSAVEVYVDARPMADARERAVDAHLGSLNLSGGHEVHSGVDPRSLHPVAADLQRLSKTESGSVAAPPAAASEPPAPLPGPPK